MTLPSTYRERLLPKWWAWLVAFSLVLMIAVAYGAALEPLIGLAVGIVGGAVAAWLLWISAPVIEVSDGQLRVAGACLPCTSIAEVTEIDAAGIAELRGPGSDARLFVSLRPWSTSSGVLVRLDDPDDPHPAWLFSSRDPGRVHSALAATMDH